MRAYDLRGDVARWLGYSFIGLSLLFIPYGLILENAYCLVNSAIFFVIGVVLVFLSKTLLPIQVYDVGILISNNMWKTGYFLSWGDIRDIKECKGITKSYYDIVNKAGGKLRIRKDLKGFSEAIEEIRHCIGREDFKVSIESEKKRKIQEESWFIVSQWIQLHSDIFEWVPPEAAHISFVKYDLDIDSWSLCEKLLNEYKVLVIPGICYGYDNFIRIGVGKTTTEKVVRGILQIEKCLETLT